MASVFKQALDRCQCMYLSYPRDTLKASHKPSFDLCSTVVTGLSALSNWSMFSKSTGRRKFVSGRNKITRSRQVAVKIVSIQNTQRQSVLDLVINPAKIPPKPPPPVTIKLYNA